MDRMLVVVFDNEVQAYQGRQTLLQLDRRQTSRDISFKVVENCSSHSSKKCVGEETPRPYKKLNPAARGRFYVVTHQDGPNR